MVGEPGGGSDNVRYVFLRGCVSITTLSHPSAFFYFSTTRCPLSLPPLPRPPLSVVIQLLKQAIQLQLGKIHVVTSLDFVKKEINNLPAKFARRFWTAPNCKGHRVTNWQQWEEIYLLLQRVDVTWDFDGSKSDVFRRVLVTAEKYTLV